MKNPIKKLVYLAEVTLILILPVSINAQGYSKGRITDTVKCLDHSDQSYSLYLPAGYTEKKRWPVIMIFDPGGQGSVAMEVFRIAAEKYGYILACSHNSRNGPLNNNFDAAGFMLTDLSRRLALNDKRIYTAGFSGGSRFALALASSNNFIAGVIGCGAGLPNDKSLYPSEKSSFVYYGIAGNRDMNYLELFDLMTFFNNRTQIIPYLRTFDGGHQWPSSEILQEAVEWINLQSINKKLIPVDSAFISSCSNKIKTLVNDLTSSGNRYDAARYMRYAVRDFSGIKVAQEMTKLLTVFELSKDYREQNREWSSVASQERKMNEKYISSIRDIIYSGNVPDTTASWWKREIGSLKLMKEKTNPRNSQMASRLLNFVSILCSEQGTAYYRQKQYDLSGFLFELCTLSDSENPNNYYNHARSLSCSDKKREAIEVLKKAIEHGFTSRKTAEIEPAFNNIRNEKMFKSLLMKLK